MTAAGADGHPPSPAPADDAVNVRDELRDTATFSIVGVGASAGGLEAFTQLLKALPADTGMAFVLVQHLAPTHASALAEILSRATQMPVMEVHDEPTVEPNHVYVIPPARSMVIAGGTLHLLPREGRGAHHPVDQFFRSLAVDRRHRAIGVVLSGTASDGTIGLQAIKAEGGITFAQDDTAQQSGMPHSAIAAGSVDFVLPPDAIAREIIRIGRHPYTVPQPEAAEPGAEPDLSQVLRLLHGDSGVDFTDYKFNTLYRRITRRMVLRKLNDLEQYVAFLRQNPAELEALYHDILINVTSFFRDPEVFDALKEKVFPRLIKEHRNRDPVRVWTIGCSTGEEAYSVAMAWAEFAQAAGSKVPVQVFATDLNEAGVTTARGGVYPKDIAQDVSAERLRRFFVEVDGHYRIAKEIREACVFSRHNVLGDPPFSRIDLISCRNVLIYLERVLQQKVVPTLHYALKPGGFLWLGSSETVGAFRNLFEVEDGKHKIYAKKPGSVTRAGYFPVQHGASPRAGFAPVPARPSGGNDLHREADRVLLSKFAPPSVLVTADLEILQYRGDTGAYLAPAPGKASLHLLKMLREGLVGGVRAAVLRAGKEQAPVRHEGLRVRSNGGWRDVAVEVIPLEGVGDGAQGGFLVLFDEAGETDERQAANAPLLPSPLPVAEEDNARLAQELADTRDYLQALIEQQEVANEELQSANEEVQSANEELQSVNEELETSKEELQSSNEELATVNDELNNRNAELSRLNNDLVNLLGSIQTPIVMLGADLRIRRFTPAAEKLFHLVPGDIGRPIGAIKLEFDLPELEPLLARVLDTVSAEQREVRDTSGRWYSLRLRPYRTLENKIDGVVMMLIDVDLLKRAHEYTQSIVRTVREPLLVLDADLRVRTANDAFYRTFQVEPEATQGRLIYELGNGQWDIPALRKLLEDVLPRNAGFADSEVEHEFSHIGRKAMLLNAQQLVQEFDQEASILLAIEDITERKRADDRLRQYAADLAESDHHKTEFLAMLAHELRNPLAPIRNAVQILQRTSGDEQALDSAAMIERQVGQLVRLVDDLLDVSRISRGKIELRKAHIELASVVHDAVNAARPQCESLKLRLSVTLPPQGIYLDADPARLVQVLGNLLNNACKFTKEGGHIGLTVHREGEQVVVRVRDSGIGIPTEQLPRIFDMFMQGDTSLERSVSGLGIGLTMVKKLVELHGGAVEVHSAGVDLGSEFIVRLPVLDRPGPSPEPSGREPTPATPRRILVVDDNDDAAASLAELLELAGNETHVASDGLEAVEAAERLKPDLVLLDIGLPKLNGYEACRRIREQPWGKRMTLVALTGWGQEEDRQRSKEAGFDNHLVKPLDYDALMRVLASLRTSESASQTSR